MKKKTETAAVVLMAALPFVCGMSFAADVVEWNGTSGNWSDGGIWEGGQPPTKDQIAGFKSGRTGTVVIDGDYQVHTVYVRSNNSETSVAESPVTFAGSGSLVATNTTFLVNTKRRFILDGPTLRCSQVNVEKALEVRGGTLSCGWLRPGNDYTVISVTGGHLAAGELSGASGALLAMTNAVLSFGKINTVCRYELSGGSLAVTNGGLAVASGVAEARFDVDSFSLAGTLSAADEGTKVVFGRSVTVGAYGNWGTENVDEMIFAGDVVFDTSDRSGGASGRRIDAGDIGFRSRYASLSVVGCGTLGIRTDKRPFRLGRLSLGEGATLDFDSDLACVMSPDSLVMEDLSKISFMAGKASFEVWDTSISDSAFLTVAFSGSANFHQIWTDLSGGEFPDIRCECGDGYSLCEAGPFVFLSNGAASSSTKGTLWTGDGADNKWSTLGNWKSSVPKTTGAPAYFSGGKNTEVDHDISDAIPRLHFSDSPAFSFTGLPFVFSSENVNVNNSPIYQGSAMPVAVYNDVKPNKAKTDGLSFVSANSSFLALMGEVALTNMPFHFSGDVRIGGSLNCSSVFFDPNGSTHKPTCLTVLPGAEVVATAQSVLHGIGTGYDVRPGGVLDVRAGTWGWTIPVTNVIDGTFKLGAAPGEGALVPCFGGRGTIVVGGDAATGAGMDAVVVGSNTVSTASDAVLGKWTVDAGATLTLDSDGNTFTLTETIDGDGRLVFASGTKVTLGGNLADAAFTSEGAVIATAAEITGALQLPESYKVYLEDSADGMTYRVKRRYGIMISIQ